MQIWDLLRNITSSSSLLACHIWQWSHPFILVIIQLFLSCIEVCLFGMFIWNEKIVYFYWYLASNKNNTAVTCPSWVFDILYRSISTLTILGSYVRNKYYPFIIQLTKVHVGYDYEVVLQWIDICSEVLPSSQSRHHPFDSDWMAAKYTHTYTVYIYIYIWW